MKNKKSNSSESVLWNAVKSASIFMFAGGIGGLVTPIVVGWWCPQWGADYFFGRTALSSGDAVSIANTYIVFTTLFFVGITVLLAFGTIELTRHFNQNKEERLVRFIEDDLIPRIEKDENFGGKFASAFLGNRDFSQALINKVEGAAKSFLLENEPRNQCSSEIDSMRQSLEE